MKSVFLVFACCCITGFMIQDSRKAQICRKWRMVGIKQFGNAYHEVSASEKLLVIKQDGTFEQLLYGRLKLTGRWKFSSDSTKLAFGVSELNGKTLPQSLPVEKAIPTDSIMRLTKDTLVYASLAFFGPKKVRGHHDWYFVQEK